MREAAAPTPRASCPSCGAAAPPAAPGCRACGFAFVEAEQRRRRPRPRLTPFAIGGAVAAVVMGVALLATGKPASTDPARTPDKQFDKRLVSLRHERPAAVRCPRPIQPKMTVRCNVLNPSGAVQLILVTLSRSGELGVDVP